MNINRMLSISVTLLLSGQVCADLVEFDLTVSAENLMDNSQHQLSDVDEGKTKISQGFKYDGKQYVIDLNYKALSQNRSYPTALNITLKDDQDKKLGYLFFANNGIDHLKALGEFGLIVNVEGTLIDIKFDFKDDSEDQGTLLSSSLVSERFMQDTLVPKFNFQMIRPVILPLESHGVRSLTYSLDSHPYAVNYTLKDISKGVVQFQYNLYGLQSGEENLLERIYVNAGSLENLRSAMFAGKYFDEQDGTFKLVFYPVMGQTEQ